MCSLLKVLDQGSQVSQGPRFTVEMSPVTIEISLGDDDSLCAQSPGSIFGIPKWNVCILCRKYRRARIEIFGVSSYIL